MRLIDADKIPWSYRQKLGLGIDYGLDEPDHYYTVVKDRVDAMPTVEAEPVKHGKYIGTEFDGYADGCPVYYEWKCSECGCVFEEEEPTYNYCPNCGAKMDEGKEDD